MSRVQVETTKQINPTQLKRELGDKDVFTSPGVVQAEGSTKAALQTAVDAHTPDPNYGKPQEDRDLATLRTKALEVFAGTGTFTAAQSQKILAGLVLRMTRD